MDSKRLRPFLERAKSGIFQIGCGAAIAAVSCVRLAGQSRSHSASGTPSASSQAGARNRALAEAQRGVALAHESKYKHAIAHYRAAEALDPHLPGLYLSLGLAYFKAQRLSDAAVALERAVKADPDNLQARTVLGMSYYGMRRFADAAAQLRIASREQPGNGQLRYLRVQSYMRSRQHSSAIKEAMQEFSEIKRFAREKHPPPLLSQIGGAKKGTKPDRASAVPAVGKH